MGAIPQGKSPQINHLWPHHRSMARAMANGARPGEVAEAFGMGPAHITRIINSPLFLAELNKLESQAAIQTQNVNQELQHLAEEGVADLSAELEDLRANGKTLEERKLKTTLIFGVLDRAGYGKADKSLHLHKHQHEHREVKEMSDDDLFRDVITLAQETTEENG